MKNVFKDSGFVEGRLLSLDFFRGFTMFLLVVEFTNFYNLLTNPTLEGMGIHAFGMQFHHHPWNGLRFWDLIQPFFMFIVGVAIPFSVRNRFAKGETERQITIHVLKRSLILLLLGWGLYCISAGHIVFRFQNVLAQLAITYPIAYFLMKRSWTVQLGWSFFLILITELIYRSFSVEGFDQPFVANQNFGTWLDLQYGGADLNGSWVSFNAIPTAAHTIWGVICAQLLLSGRSHAKILRMLIIAAIIGIVSGYALDTVTPIIKRISTSSFVLVSGGWTVLFLAMAYWLIDVKGWKRGVFFFAVVGMNPLFIYLFAHLGGAEFVSNIVKPFAVSFIGQSGDFGVKFVTSIVVTYLMWYICYWLYKRKIFIKI